MTKMKKLLIVGAVVLTVAVTAITSFAASEYNSPAEALAALTSKTEEQLIQEKQESGTTFGAIAEENGVLDAFKAEVLQIRKDRIEAKVADGTLTREKADEIIKAIEDRIANCDGTGSSGNFGLRSGNGAGSGMRNGEGRGNRQGMGKGICGGQGSCVTE
ncbi:MAG: DUF2680 domain-containing protein [Eubacteriales bacterium]